MSHRFFAPTMCSAGETNLTEGEAHHLAHVLRMTAGDSIEVFNGRGLVGIAVVKQIRKREVDCEVIDVTQESRETPEITLATAVPKGERFDWLIEKAVELGVSRIIPLLTERSVVDPREGKLDRLRHTIIAACKQSRRSYLMELAPLISFRELMGQVTTGSVFCADPYGRPWTSLPALIWSSPTWTCVIGPEGGFTDEEREFAKARGAQFVSLGRQILRVETAGLAMAAYRLLGQPSEAGNRLSGQDSAGIACDATKML